MDKRLVTPDGAKIIQYRQRIALTAEEFAEAAGLDKSTISSIERGKQCYPKNLQAIAGVFSKHGLKVEVEGLMFKEEEQKVHEIPSPRVNHETEKHLIPSPWRFRWVFIIIAIGSIASVLSWLTLNKGRPHIESPTNDSTVSSFEDVTVTGMHDSQNVYLIVEPLDKRGRPIGRRWVQGRILAPGWTIRAQFGEVDTPSGTRFLVYLLSTKSVLRPGELKTEPENSRVLASIIVTLQKQLRGQGGRLAHFPGWPRKHTVAYSTTHCAFNRLPIEPHHCKTVLKPARSHSETARAGGTLPLDET